LGPRALLAAVRESYNSSMSPPEGLPASVLVADDDALVRTILRLVLTRAGYMVTEACDAVEVIRVAHSQRPDLVILDINMPGGTVHDTLGSLREVLPELPILVLSGELETPVDLLGVALDFARKPIGRDELLARVKSLLSFASMVS